MNASNSSIAEIKDRLNIVDVLSSFIQLKKAGSNYKAPCPFHHEKTASLMVSPTKQIWHCFGCGEGGDIFGFVMKYENVEFGEALKILADRAGVQLPKFTKENAEKDQYRDILFGINELAAKFYAQVLEKSSVAEGARQYLAKRSLGAATLKEWQIGFAPNEFHLLENFLLKKNYSAKQLLDAGVSAKSARGDVYDRFFNRITFPIVNYSGQVAGFTARILEADAKAAKYVNSPETEIYNKSKIIFGLYQAKQAIRKEDYVIIVEGNMDVITAHQAGFKNVVASSGTAFTYDQLQTLSRLTKNLKFAFDTDAAGQSATRRTLDLALQLGFSVYIVRIAGAKDPDELIQKNPKAFAEAVTNAPLYLDYFMEKSFENFDPSSMKQINIIVDEIVPLLNQLIDPVEIGHYARILAQRLNVPEKSVYQKMNELKNKNKSKDNKGLNVEKKPIPLHKPRTYLVEQKLLGYALFKPEFAEEIKSKTRAEDFKDPETQAFLRAFGAKNAEQSIDEFIEASSTPELAKIALFMVESEYHQLDNSAVFEKEFRALLKEFASNNIKIALKELSAEMVLAEQKKDKQKLAQLNNQFLELAKSLNLI